MKVSAIALLLAALASAGHAAGQDKPAFAIDAGGLDHAMLDTTTSPCNDFFRFACGGWNDANPIPADESAWGVDSALALRNRAILRTILEQAAAEPASATRKIGDFYAACMDEPKIESLGLAPLQPMLDRIAALESKDSLPVLLGQLHGTGVDALFAFGAGQDAKNAQAEIGIVEEGGMGLPDRDYYLAPDAADAAIRHDYVQHIAGMFVLAGESDAAAHADAAAVMTIETALAKGSLDKVVRRDPRKTYHVVSLVELDRLTPGFAWGQYFTAVAAPAIGGVDATEPGFLGAAGQVIEKSSVADIRTYLKWRVLTAAAPWLPKGFVDENFAFYGKRLTGATEIEPRWQRCVEAADSSLGDDLGRAYVALAFPAEAKARIRVMVDAVAAAFETDLRTLDWMGPQTRDRALEKLALMRKKLGYPDHWRDYGALDIRRDDALGNATRAAGFELARELGKIGKPVDRDEWEMTAPTVNAYYDPQMNDINLAAGILQPPFFSAGFDDAIGFGATGGGTVGHEMTHGFDDEGRGYDGHGNLADWWTKADAARFEQRAQCVAEQFSSYIAVDTVHVNGRLTLGENVADLGGVRLGYAALMTRLGGNGDAAPIGGFTPAQRYFIGYAQSWCGTARPAEIRLHTMTDPHAPPIFRVNGVVSDMPEFRAAFSCKPDAPMVRAKACRVW